MKTNGMACICVLALLALGARVSAGEEAGAVKMKNDKDPVVSLQTSMGEIQVELYEDDAPNTVGNFVSLVEKKFYDGILFHRIIKDFMIQGGDPTGTGMGGPGYKFPDELTNNPNKNEQYALSMANAGANTNGSQFFLITKAGGTPWLNGKHCVFGQVIKGRDVVDKLGAVQTGAGDRPVQEVKIITAKVVSKRDHAYTVKDTVPGR